MKRAASVSITIILAFSLYAACNILIVRGSDTVYIRADGSVDPPTAPISTLDNVTYTLTSNINDSIVVERDNIVIDGAGYTLQGTDAYNSKGIDLNGRINVTISNIEIKAFDYGIRLDSSSNNIISGNNITNNGGGITLQESSNNTLRNNDVSSNEYNFGIYGESLSHYIHDIDDSNTVDGKLVYYWVNRRDMTVPLDAGYVALVNCTRISVKNLTLTNNEKGLLLASTTNSTITNNNITNNRLGIFYYRSSNNTVSKNNITNNRFGIELNESSNNTVSGNSITNNDGGVRIHSSSGNTVSGNLITNNGDGVYLSYSSGNTVSGNSITNNERGVYLHSSSNNTVSGNNITNNGGGVWLYSSSNNNTVSGNNITANSIQGVILSSSSNNTTVSMNNIDNNFWGVVLNESSNNTVSGNNITNNDYGVWVDRSDNSEFYHNYFIDNINQANVSQVFELGYAYTWDKGYPTGGNYWSDYLERYPNATEIDGMGIWDTPYVIDEHNKDNYPIVPEFPTWTSIILILTMLTVTIATYRQRLCKTPIQ